MFKKCVSHEVTITSSALTLLCAFLGVPNGQPVAIQVLLSLPVNFKVHLHLPVFQMAGLETHKSHKANEIHQIHLSPIFMQIKRYKSDINKWEKNKRFTNLGMEAPADSHGAVHQHLRLYSQCGSILRPVCSACQVWGAPARWLPWHHPSAPTGRSLMIPHLRTKKKNIIMGKADGAQQPTRDPL